MAMNLMEKLSYLGVVLPTLSPSAWFGGGEPFDATGAGGLNVRLYRSWPDNPRVIDDWSRLARDIPCGSVFQSPAWQGALARPFLRVGRYRLLTVHRGEALHAVLPMQLGLAGSLETPGEMISDYLEPLVEQSCANEAWRCVLALLREQCAGELPLTLHNVPGDGPCRQVLSSVAREEGFAIEDVETAQAGRIVLPQTWEEYLAKLPGRERKELKRKLKNATTQAGARMTVATAGPRLHAELERVFGYMEAAGGSKGFKSRWTYRRIFRSAADDLAAAGQLTVCSLQLNDRPAAGVICFPSPSGPMLWAAGFDPATSRQSPGIVLFALAIRASIESGARYFDLLRGQSRYKSELGATDYPLRRLTLSRKTY
jgi:CelD/BcsL family acetyltransferase involved in cellulose biosynthesis